MDGSHGGRAVGTSDRGRRQGAGQYDDGGGAKKDVHDDRLLVVAGSEGGGKVAPAAGRES
jgi:hypothetical protein